jgi:hypothetical protein
MKFMISYDILPDKRDESGKRFLQTGGGPPSGVTMLGRYHRVGGLGGWVLAESKDLEALARWTHAWTDLLTFQITPVIEDEVAGKVLKEAVG